MLFFSYEFLYLFLPVVFLGFWALVRLSGQNLKICLLWLVSASLVFYGYWKPIYLLLIGTSILINFFVGRYLHAHKSRPLLVLALVFNLGLLSYYKYLGFFASIFNDLTGQSLTVGDIVLPLAISFFTFQQVAWVVDNYTRHVSEGRVDFGEYLLFVVFFPQLIAGPIVHHSEIIPQFRDRSILRFNPDNVATGLAIFIIGMFKKVVLADNIAPMPATVFNGAAWGITYGAFDTWLATVAYPMQVYFDFSAYGDMAIGLGLLFNIRLPINFESPHKSLTMVEYWRRWHMTLGRFLRSYVYIPLGGNRKGFPRTCVHVVITLALGGLWHGAGWTFVLWGTSHGLFQVVNLIWSRFSPWRLPVLLAWLATFLATTVAHSFFPAHDMESAVRVLKVMFFISDDPAQAANISLQAYALIIGSFIGVLVFPSSRQLISERYTPIQFDNNTISERAALQIPVLDSLRIRLTWPWLGYLAAVAGITLYTLLNASTVQEFVYFQF